MGRCRFSKRHCRLPKGRLALPAVVTYIGAWAVIIFSGQRPLTGRFYLVLCMNLNSQREGLLWDAAVFRSGTVACLKAGLHYRPWLPILVPGLF